MANHSQSPEAKKVKLAKKKKNGLCLYRHLPEVNLETKTKQESTNSGD